VRSSTEDRPRARPAAGGLPVSTRGSAGKRGARTGSPLPWLAVIEAGALIAWAVA